MSQNHFTVRFPLKTPADAEALAEQLPPLMPVLFQAQEIIGTIHYSRFTILSKKTLLFLGDFDGECGPLMAELAKYAGPVFDAIFLHADNPPPTPVTPYQQPRYRSNVLFRHGPIDIVKYSATPLSENPARPLQRSNPKGLQDELIRHLREDGKMGNSTPDSTPVGSINRARWPAEVASRKARMHAESHDRQRAACAD